LFCILFQSNIRHDIKKQIIETPLTENIRGLDNAGKTTILKRFNGEEIDTISPTLGFNIKTLEHKGYYFLC
jgi:ADP-ribosylation factor-like protein 2